MTDSINTKAIKENNLENTDKKENEKSTSNVALKDNKISYELEDLHLKVILIQLPKDLIRELELIANYHEGNLQAIIFIALDIYAEKEIAKLGI
jgi:hypothetical protein